METPAMFLQVLHPASRGGSGTTALTFDAVALTFDGAALTFLPS
jgi:hypothetical protein